MNLLPINSLFVTVWKYLNFAFSFERYGCWAQNIRLANIFLQIFPDVKLSFSGFGEFCWKVNYPFHCYSFGCNTSFADVLKSFSSLSLVSINFSMLWLCTLLFVPLFLGFVHYLDAFCSFWKSYKQHLFKYCFLPLPLLYSFSMPAN